jgi:type II secretory pathway component PulC
VSGLSKVLLSPTVKTLKHIQLATFSLRKGDILLSINGAKVGLETLRDILFRMKQGMDMMLQVIRK